MQPCVFSPILYIAQILFHVLQKIIGYQTSIRFIPEKEPFHHQHRQVIPKEHKEGTDIALQSGQTLLPEPSRLCQGHIQKHKVARQPQGIVRQYQACFPDNPQYDAQLCCQERTPLRDPFYDSTFGSYFKPLYIENYHMRNLYSMRQK